jgi:hypothetical protein
MNSVKNILVALPLLIIMLFSGCGNNSGNSSGFNQAGDTGTARIVFKEYEHHFGKVTEGEKISYIFRFDNTGTSNLVIASANTTCGCTVPNYSTKPIPPGKSGNIEVVFNTSGRNGMQTKTITVKSNAKPPVVLLKITAEVEAGSKE